jgi:16S rRNA (uracil1498-N3)-methyltransferase
VSTRFYCPDPPRDGRYHLGADEARHLARVCRHGPGDLVELFDGRGFATAARVLEVGKDRALLAAEGDPIPEDRPPCSLTLATAIPKGDRFDWLVEKATEIGVDRLIPLVTERSVVDPRGSKLERLRRTVVEACKQSRRSRLMALEPAAPWGELARAPGAVVRLIARPGRLPPGRRQGSFRGQSVILAVGPEGGFSPAEEALAEAFGWRPIRLGPHVLRVETAGLAGAAIILASCEERDDDGDAVG